MPLAVRIRYVGRYTVLLAQGYGTVGPSAPLYGGCHHAVGRCTLHTTVGLRHMLWDVHHCMATHTPPASTVHRALLLWDRMARHAVCGCYYTLPVVLLIAHSLHGRVYVWCATKPS